MILIFENGCVYSSFTFLRAFGKSKEKPDEDTSGAGHTFSPPPLHHNSHVHVYQDVYMLMPSVEISDGPH